MNIIACVFALDDGMVRELVHIISGYVREGFSGRN